MIGHGSTHRPLKNPRAGQGKRLEGRQEWGHLTWESLRRPDSLGLDLEHLDRIVHGGPTGCKQIIDSLSGQVFIPDIFNLVPLNELVPPRDWLIVLHPVGRHLSFLNPSIHR